MRILKGSFQRVKVVLGSSDPVEEANQLMRDGVFIEEGNLFDCVEDDRGFEDGSIE